MFCTFQIKKIRVAVHEWWKQKVMLMIYKPLNVCFFKKFTETRMNPHLVWLWVWMHKWGMGWQNAHTYTKTSHVCVFIHSSAHFFSLLPSSLCLSQLDTPVILSPQLLMFLLVYVILYKLTLWNMNTWEENNKIYSSVPSPHSKIRL